MIKAERNYVRSSSVAEEMERTHRKLMAINSLEKRTKSKGKKSNLFKEKKETLKRNLEKLRRG